MTSSSPSSPVIFSSFGEFASRVLGVHYSPITHHNCSKIFRKKSSSTLLVLLIWEAQRLFRISRTTSLPWMS